MCLRFTSLCSACPLIFAVLAFIGMFCVDEPVFDEMGVLTS